jgi:hypothetical protein
MKLVTSKFLVCPNNAGNLDSQSDQYETAVKPFQIQSYNAGLPEAWSTWWPLKSAESRPVLLTSSTTAYGEFHEYKAEGVEGTSQIVTSYMPSISVAHRTSARKNESGFSSSVRKASKALE